MTQPPLRPRPAKKRRLSEASVICAEAARRRLSRDPDDVDALFTLAVWHAILGETQRSLALLDRVTRRAHEYPRVWRVRAHVYRRLGNEKMAALCEQAASRSEG